jgi:DNA-binding beta-propeller fold protein YncE
MVMTNTQNTAGWVISTTVGTGAQGYAGDGGPAAQALLNNPFDLAFDPDGNLVFSDTFNHCIRRVDARGGTISTIAGTGEATHDGDGGPATAAGIFGARAVALAPDGTLYIMERQGSSIRRVRNGTIETVAGTGARGYAGDGHDARHAVFNAPKEMALDPAGNIFVVDTENHAIRRIDAASWIVDTIAGGSSGPGGDNGPARAAGLARPHGAVVAPDGAIYIGDSENHRVRKLEYRG